MKEAIIFLSCFLLMACTVSGQSVEGQVRDEETGEPVEFASVYFVNTTNGTTTRSDGSFSLKAFSPGKYVLNVSFVGYATFSQDVILRENEVVSIHITLRPATVSLPAVYIRADTTDWPVHYEVFLEHFLGTSRPARQCTIENPRALVFYHDELRNRLYAHARSPLVIRNEYLGYEITYEMKSFVYDIQEGTINYLGIARFTELPNTGSPKRWERNRARTYDGSPTLFFRTLFYNTIEEAGFRVNILHRKPNPTRLPDPVIRQRIAYYQRQAAGRNTSLRYKSVHAFQDSLEHYTAMLNSSKYIDRLGPRISNSAQLMEGNRITFNGWLEIAHKGNQSEIQISEPVTIYQNGYFEDIRSVFYDGYWGNEYTIATMLPLDYRPGQVKR